MQHRGREKVPVFKVFELTNVQISIKYCELKTNSTPKTLWTNCHNK